MYTRASDKGRLMANPLFERKPLALLLEEMKGENRLRRILGPVTLTSLGVGAIIGTGIFVLTGVGAHDKAGPALTLSFALAGIACVFAALCYAEFASMVPGSGFRVHVCVCDPRRAFRVDYRLGSGFGICGGILDRRTRLVRSFPRSSEEFRHPDSV